MSDLNPSNLDPVKVILRTEPDSARGSIELIGPNKEVSDTYWFDLPWLEDKEWHAVFRSLELYMDDKRGWPTEEVLDIAKGLKLFSEQENHPSKDRFRVIGQTLFETVFPKEEIKQFLYKSIYAAGENPILEIHIQDHGSILQSYPWELLFYGNKFINGRNQISLVRHVDFEEKITPLDLDGLLHVLYIAPRPDMSSFEDYADLPIQDRLVLEHLNRSYSDNFSFHNSTSNTLDSLHYYLMQVDNIVHVIHIDSHGAYGWLCNCNYLNSPNSKQCFQCERHRTEVDINQGYLAFENDDGTVHWVLGESLGERLNKKGVKVVILSACRSGLVGGKSTFNSVAGALVNHKIPAVVAMQFSIEINQAKKFAEFFYWALINGMPLTEAVREARISLSQESRHRPVLYIRTDSSNPRGKIFERKSPLEIKKKKFESRELWIDTLGFRRDPFIYLYGGEDPYLQEYFYTKMKNFRQIKGDISKLGTVLVFGPSGSGKSSLRNVISQFIRNDDILPITYQDFGSVASTETLRDDDYLKNHLAQIIKSTLRELIKLARDSDFELKKQSNEEKDNIIRNQFWLYINKFEDDPLSRFTLESLLQPKLNGNLELPSDDRDLLGQFFKYVIELFGYKYVYILVDPEDNSVPDTSLAWEILKPLLYSRLLNLSDFGVSFKFFLEKKFHELALGIPWIEKEQSRRVYHIEWDHDELRDLLRERIWQSSDGRYESIDNLTEEVEKLENLVIQYSSLSPREMIALCNSLFEEHSRKWSLEKREPLLITQDDVDKVLEPFKRQLPLSSLEQLIKEGESSRVEFKSTMRFNLFTKKKDSEMEMEIARTLCAFMNTEGGTLIIGVKDDGNVLGLDEDFSTLKRKNQDGFMQAFVNITDHLFDSPIPPDAYSAEFERPYGKIVYKIEVKQSDKPVFCKFGNETEFYIRKQTTTRKLNPKEFLEYLEVHFR